MSFFRGFADELIKLAQMEEEMLDLEVQPSGPRGGTKPVARPLPPPKKGALPKAPAKPYQWAKKPVKR